MSKLNTFDVVSLKTHREIVQDMRNDADILRTQLDETLATNAAIAERAAKLESQIEATHRAIDSIGLGRCADSRYRRDANGCVTCDDGRPPLSLAERTEWLIRWLSDDPYPMGPRIKALEAALDAAQADAARLRAALTEVEWVDQYDPFCPWCKNDHKEGHRPDCQRQAALAQTSEVKLP